MIAARTITGLPYDKKAGVRGLMSALATAFEQCGAELMGPPEVEVVSTRSARMGGEGLVLTNAKGQPIIEETKHLEYTFWMRMTEEIVPLVAAAEQAVLNPKKGEQSQNRRFSPHMDVGERKEIA